MLGAAVPPLLAAQAVVMLIDELYFHRRRGLPRWERLGHPLDTLSVLACYAIALCLEPSSTAVGCYVAAAVFSALFVTKDERIHAALSPPAEHWLHAVSFMLHPLVLALVGLLWVEGNHRLIIAAQAGATLAFGLYQLAYWNIPWKQLSSDR